MSGSGKATIDWGDGTSDTYVLTDLRAFCPHIYSRATAHNITINSYEVTLLYCSYDQLTDLDVSKNTALAYLSCSSNQLTMLDIGDNPALVYLFCEHNQLMTLDASGNPALTQLDCSSNQLATLDVSRNFALSFLVCNSNRLTTLDASNHALAYLSCSSNQLTALDVSNNPILGSVECSYNQLQIAALNDLFEMLPSIGGGTISLGYNPGTVGCDTNIAADKGWMVTIKPL